MSNAHVQVVMIINLIVLKKTVDQKIIINVYLVQARKQGSAGMTRLIGVMINLMAIIVDQKIIRGGVI